MATANRKTQKKRPLWLKLSVLLIVVSAATGWMYRAPIAGQTGIATAYGARMACSCHYVGGRDLGQCKADFEPGMALVMLSQDEGTKSVTATIPLLSSSTARYRPDYGCVLESWKR